MSEKTYIKGKDSDLESTIATMRAKLNAIGIELKEGAMLNPLPHLFSSHIHDSTYRMMFTNGKGASQKASEASALGEYFERLSCNYFFADYYLGEAFAEDEFVHYPNEKWFDIEDDDMPEELLDEALWEYFDPEEDLSPSDLFDLNSGEGERGLCALPFVRERDDEVIYFPVNIIGNIFVSNGMAAGNTKSEARVQALSEIFERYVKNKVISQGLSLPLIPKEVIAKYPQTQEAISALESHGYHLHICDASLGGKYPVISVTLINPEDGSVLPSFGAHPSFEVALERTVTELLQGRTLEMLNDFFPPTFNLEEVADPQNLEAHFINATGLLSYDFFKEERDYEFVYWDFDGDTDAEYAELAELIHDEGFDIYCADYDHLGIDTCRILVPGMSDIYPVEDLVWRNNNEGACYRERFLTLDTLDEDDYEELIEELEDDNINDMLNVAEFIGVVADEDSHWSKLTMGELKAMLYLAVGDIENAQEWNRWSLEMENVDGERLRYHRCLDALMEIILKEKEFKLYIKPITLMYGETLMKTCVAVINQERTFYGLEFPGLSLEGFKSHQKLLDVYAKVHKAKRDRYKQIDS